MRQVRGWKRSEKVRRAAMECLEDRRLCHAGDLDPSFSDDGTANFSAGGTTVVASMDTRGGRTVVVGGTGKAAMGYVTGVSNIVAYNNSGNLDTTFSSDGLRPMPRLTNPHDIFIQPDGKILVVGQVDGVAGVARMLKNGSADTSFSGDGFVTIPQMSQATGVRLNSAGKIVISGYTANTPDGIFAAARLNVNGSMDTSFSGDGFAQLNVGGRANAVAVQSDGKIVLVGAMPNSDTITDIAVVRVTTFGELDTSFSGDGWTTFGNQPNNFASSVDITPGGRILVGATFATTFAGVLRLTSSGEFDALIEPSGSLESESGVVVNNVRSSFDGNQIYMMVDRYEGASRLVGSTVVRFDSDGTMDYTFGDQGRIDSTGEGHGDLQSDGKLITAGNPLQIGPNGPQGNYTRVQARRRISAIDSKDRIQLQENIIVEGTTGDDKILVTHNLAAHTITVKLNSLTRTFNDTGITDVRVNGGKGNDTIDIRGSFLQSQLDGGEGNDTIYGHTKNDFVHGGEGNDNIVTDGGLDVLNGDSGDDVLNGGDGDDSLYGGTGRDRVYGYGGNDALSGMEQGKVDHVPDYIDGGAGNDIVFTKEDDDATFSIEFEA